MYKEVNFSTFHDEFHSIRPNQFSYDALRELFDYYEQIEETTGEKMELDVIAICCEWTEYESLEDFQKEYGEKYETIEDIEDRTQVIELDGGSFLVQQF